MKLHNVLESLTRLARRVGIALALLLITYNVLLFYGFSERSVIVLPLLGIFFLLYLWTDWKNGLVLSLSLLFTTLLLNGLLGLMKIEERIYYRAHEKLSAYNHDLDMKTYRKNADLTFEMPFGDVYAVGRGKDIEKEPRPMRFRTDSLGFRNSSDYAGEKYVLVGDSFTVCNGTSQEESLATQLRDTYRLPVYALAYAGGIPEYVKYIRYFEEKVSKDFKVFLFLFEGNDFSERFSRRQLSLRKSMLKSLRDRYKSFFHETVLYRYTSSLIARRTHDLMATDAFSVHGCKIADFSLYVRTADRQSYEFPEKVVAMLSLVRHRIDHIFFIPTKYRVYYPFLDGKGDKPLPNAHWEEVKRLSARLNVGCTDLTGPLTDASRNLLKEKKFTFWKDDSHWNKYGIAVAAKVVFDHANGSHPSQ